MKNKIAKEGDIISWQFDDDINVLERFRGKKYSAKVAMVNIEDKVYGVYAEYGPDLIDFDKTIILKK